MAVLRKYRKDAGLTQAQLAEGAGVTQGCVSAIELGKRVDIAISTAQRILRVLRNRGVDCSLERLFPVPAWFFLSMAFFFGLLRSS